MSRDRIPLRYFSFWLVLGWLLIATVVYLSLASTGLPKLVPQGDKAQHFLAYLVLTLWFSQLYRSPVRTLFALGFVALGVSLEFLQGLTVYRTFSTADMAANATGALVGWLLGATALGRVLVWLELWLEKTGSVAPRGG